MKKITAFFVMSLIITTIMAQDWSKIAFLCNYDDVATFNANADDDEKAAGDWLFGKGGVFLSLSAIKNGTDDLSDYKAIWLHLDKEIADDPVNVFLNTHLAPFQDTDVLTPLTNYYKAGGNIFLSIHASHYIVDLGRFATRPENNGFGTAGNNADTWYTTATYGTWLGNIANVVDHSGDPIFDGLASEMITRDNGEEYKRFPLIGAGEKEDHNCFWHTDTPGYNNDTPGKFDEFYNLYKATPLATWDHITDYYGGGIIRWDAQGDYLGKCFTVGLAAYEWNQNSGANQYQSNIEKLTENILKELAPDTGGGMGNNMLNENDLNVVFSNNILKISNSNSVIKDIDIYDVTGKCIRNYPVSQAIIGIDCNELNNGIYIVKITGENEVLKIRKIIKN